MSTKEVCQNLGVNQNTIRYHIGTGKLTPPRKDKRGRYTWRERDVNRLVKFLTTSTRS